MYPNGHALFELSCVLPGYPLTTASLFYPDTRHRRVAHYVRIVGLVCHSAASGHGFHAFQPSLAAFSGQTRRSEGCSNQDSEFAGEHGVCVFFILAIPSRLAVK